MLDSSVTGCLSTNFPKTHHQRSKLPRRNPRSASTNHIRRDPKASVLAFLIKQKRALAHGVSELNNSLPEPKDRHGCLSTYGNSNSKWQLARDGGSLHNTLPWPGRFTDRV